MLPAFEVLDDRSAAGTSDDPDDVLVAVVDLLVLGECRDEGKVAWRQVCSLLAALADDGAVAPGGVNDRV